MSRDDDGLAPVTPLFGSGGDHPARGRRRSTPAADGGWATDSEIRGDETIEPADASADVSADPVAETRAKLRALPAVALPTYAAFAATSEGDRDDATDDTSTESDPEPEPEESLEAAARRAENISLHALSRRGVSSHEMAKTLRSRDLPDEVVDAEIERLERVGLLNDAELAENLVRTKQDRKGLGKGAITAELRQRGLAQEAIEQAVAEIDDDEEQERADEWAVKRAGQLHGLDQATAERRLNAFLMRRGYRSEVIRRAVEKALPRGGSRGGSSRGGSSRGGVRFE